MVAPLFCPLLGVIKMKTVEINAFPPDMLILLRIELIFSDEASGLYVQNKDAALKHVTGVRGRGEAQR